MIACDKIMYVMNIASINVANTVAANVPTNSDGENIRHKNRCYVLDRVSVEIILLLLITSIGQN